MTKPQIRSGVYGTDRWKRGYDAYRRSVPIHAIVNKFAKLARYQMGADGQYHDHSYLFKDLALYVIGAQLEQWPIIEDTMPLSHMKGWADIFGLEWTFGSSFMGIRQKEITPLPSEEDLDDGS